MNGFKALKRNLNLGKTKIEETIKDIIKVCKVGKLKKARKMNLLTTSIIDHKLIYPL